MKRSYYINNPSAWECGFDQKISGELERLEYEKRHLLESLRDLFNICGSFKVLSVLPSDQYAKYMVAAAVLKMVDSQEVALSPEEELLNAAKDLRAAQKAFRANRKEMEQASVGRRLDDANTLGAAVGRAAVQLDAAIAKVESKPRG